MLEQMCPQSISSQENPGSSRPNPYRFHFVTNLIMDPQFLAELAPILPMLRGLPKPALHDVNARRQILSSFVSEPVIQPEITQEILYATSSDGYKLPIYHWKRTNPALGANDAQLAILHIHGGGFISLSASAMVTSLSGYVIETGVEIFSVDYRLAPEHPYPVPLEDCWTALQWVMDHASQLGIDKRRIAVMGESAGGGLAAGLALLARDRKLEPPLARQILGYPMLDDRNTETVAKDVITLWNEEDNATGWAAYLGAKAGGDDVPIYAAPGRATELAGLPPVYMDVGQRDLFAKDCLAYASRLTEAGVDTEIHMYPGLSHGFEGLTPNHPVAQEMRQKRRSQILRI